MYRSTRKLNSIQYLRGIAATAVVCHHALNGIASSFLAAGVDIFFVISGFIMLTVAKDESPATFAWRRVVRVVPLYWLATLVLLVLSVGFHPERANVAMARELILSLTFVPHYSLARPDTIEPLLWVGWTLNYEMFFYLVFALGLIVKRIVPTVTIVLVALAAAGLGIRFSNPALVSYADPLLLEFLAGMYLAKMQDRLGIWVSLLLPLGILGFAMFGFSHHLRVLVWGVPAFLMVAGALALERAGWLPRLELLVLLGDASYSIYLFHGFGLTFGEHVAALLPLGGWPRTFLQVAMRIGGGVALGFLVHFLIERPLLRKLTGRPRPAAASAPSHREAAASPM